MLYIDGQWQTVESPEGTLIRENPARRSEVVARVPWSRESVDRAVDSARKALSGWDRLGFERRLTYLERFSQVLQSRRDDIAQIIALEAGKPLWEARTEASALVSKIAIMSSEGAQYTAVHRPEGLNGLYCHRPLGVLAVLGPFNFPLHLPNGHIVPALLNGNTVVVKPSELTPKAMQVYFECIQEADFPPGVVNLVQGPGPVGAALAEHRDVHGILFTGSYGTGRRIQKATEDHYWKLLALEMGGKNTSLILDDAHLEQAAHEIAFAAFVTCGQRCSATSRVVIHRDVFDEFVDLLIPLTQRITTGDTLTEDVFMGPLINEAAFKRFLSTQADDEDGQLEPLLRGGESRPDLDGYFVQPGIWRARSVAPSGPHQAAEIFGPDLVLYAVDSDDQAAQVANATEYGLAMSVFTADTDRFHHLSYALRTGILNLNTSTAGASSRLPFGGVNKSGNHRPSALLAGLYTTYPQAQLHQDPDWSPERAQSLPWTLLRS